MIAHGCGIGDRFEVSIGVSRSLMLCGIIAVAACGLLPRVSAAGVQYRKQVVDHVTLHTVYVDLHDPWVQVTPAVAEDEPNRRLSFPDFMDEYQPLAQCTGTFFDFHSGEAIGDLVINGQLIPSSTRMGTVLAITADNQAFMFDVDSSDRQDWSGYESVMQGGVRLLCHGAMAVDPGGQGFHDRYMCRCTHRIAVGIMMDGRIMLLGTYNDVLLPRLAQLMLALGCRDAMALDGGGSTAFAYGGKRILNTARKLANVLMVVHRPYDPVVLLNSVLAAHDHAAAACSADLFDVPLNAGSDDEEGAMDEDAPTWFSTLDTPVPSGPPPGAPSTRKSSLFDLFSSWVAPLIHW